MTPAAALARAKAAGPGLKLHLCDIWFVKKALRAKAGPSREGCPKTEGGGRKPFTEQAPTQPTATKISESQHGQDPRSFCSLFKHKGPP